MQISTRCWSRSPATIRRVTRAYAYRLREQIQELRREQRPEDFDDATRPAELKQADWPGLVQACRDALVGEAKDLRIACHLVEGLVKTEGFAGLRDGLALIGQMIDECWDRLNPRDHDGDLASAAELLANMLDDSHRGIRFPISVRLIPLVWLPGGTATAGRAGNSSARCRDPDAAGQRRQVPGGRHRRSASASRWPRSTNAWKNSTWLLPLLESGWERRPPR